MQAFYQAELQPDLGFNIPASGTAFGVAPVGGTRILESLTGFATAMLFSCENLCAAGLRIATRLKF
jgi:hypothetical protein